MAEDISKHIKRWRWGQKPHKYQVGPLFFSKEIQLDNYFIMKLFRDYLTPDYFKDFYNYHLDYYKASVEVPDERAHFNVISEIVENGIRIQDRYPHSEIAKKRKKKLLEFRRFLKTIDQWGASSSMEELVQIKNREIEELQAKLDVAKKELSKWKVDYKIKINHVDRTSIFDLFLQVRELENSETGTRVFTDPAQSTWAKILSNHFEDDQSIPFDTALNYFRGKSKIQNKHRLFSLK
jgi:hypothetical protein